MRRALATVLFGVLLLAGCDRHPQTDGDRTVDTNNPLELTARERSWVAGHADLAPFTAPGLAIAERVGARLAQDSFGGQLPRILAFGAAIAATLALALAVAGWIVPGFGLATLAALFTAMEAVVRRVAHAGQLRPPVPWLIQALVVLLDPLLVILIASASPEDVEWLRLFVPVVLIGLLHLGERLAVQRWRRSYADRVLLTVILVPAAVLGVTLPVVAALGLATLVSLFLTPELRQ